MYGTQAHKEYIEPGYSFENDVNMYGTQAFQLIMWNHKKFENDVNVYGTQAKLKQQKK